MAAHLAGAFAANTTLPVVGIPMKGGAMDGLDALLATVQMPSGFPVATVALNGAKNAAYLAVAILAVADDELAAKLDPVPCRHRRRHCQKGRRHRCRSRSYVTSNPGLFAVVLFLFIKGFHKSIHERI
jgi:purE: phosphoribosylaminoimidazole carboxylase, catalytic subunit